MADPTGQNLYYFESPGDLFIRPIICRVKGTFSAAGATCTVSTTRRQSHPGVTIVGATGDYDVAGLPRGTDYHIEGCHILTLDGTSAPCIATVQNDSLNPAAGTLTVLIRSGALGAEVAPADGSILMLTIAVETGVNS